ncbi:cytochrome D ubiquinol oxidase subunit I [Brevibacillus sp. SKDU10]|uniref:cytochrome ubiquinol oxidase subunit I n=1 Tax=Brevibacillus sp. SKDU10 TaxID=1247872 RepID=UPI0007C90922|nr:cytochrome ubiquinol oxidase subunit I [Brevibacillus sp. SKDU10]OAJ74135.1 cytochrome D ubiquinol oxidase subunit I [Brevibacillus sp. SKDU10]
MDQILIARSTFGMTMGFHIIFASLGVGLPLMILIAELLYQRTKDTDYSLMAKRWTKGQAILLGIAIPSGTISGVQLSLLWPGFMEVVGKVISLPFQIEIFAFFLEALFLSIYVYAAHRLSPKMRIVSVLLVLIGATASAVLITNVHAFEGTPTGFHLVNGEVVDVDPWKAFFNPSFFVTAGHVVVSAYMTGAFIIASIAAYKMLKVNKTSREYAFHQKALLMGLVIGGTFSLLTGINGHDSAQHLHQYQPEKLAAAEGLFETQSHAPLVIGGITDEATQQVKYGLEIPWLLSVLAGNTPNEVVVGLNDFPRDEWPPLFVHTLFNFMVLVGGALIFVGFIGFAWKKWLKHSHYPRWVLWIFVLSGPLSMLGIEAGWIFACTGRQPWILYRVMKTADATTQSQGLGTLFLLFLGIYLFMAIATILVFRYYFRRHPISLEGEA